MRLVTAILFSATLLGCQSSAPESDNAPILLVPDVGQGHGIALVQGGRAVVFDAGPSGQGALKRALEAGGCRSIEWFVLSHPDQDHSGGLDSLESIPIEHILSGPMVATDSVRALRLCRTGTVPCPRAVPGLEFPVLDDLTLRILGPDRASPSENTNENSLVVAVSRGGRDLLLVSGDQDTAGELALLDRLRPTEVLQMGHHGSKTSSHLAWLGRASPRFVVVQAGRENGYGHPTPEALGRAVAVDAEILRPDGNTIELRFDPSAHLVAGTRP